MNFVKVSAECATTTHINMDYVVEFWWSSGKVCIQFAYKESSISTYMDKEKELYNKLCIYARN